MLIPIGQVFCQKSNEIGRRILGADPHSQLLVFQGEAYCCVTDLFKTVLSNRRPPSIASGVSQEVLFGLEIIDMGAPPSVLTLQEPFENPSMEVGSQHSSFQSLPEKRDHGESPHVH